MLLEFSKLNERAPGQAKEWCFICNCWVRAATDPTMTTDPSAGDPKRIYKVISFEFVVPSPNSTHRDAEPSPIPGQESAGVWDWPGETRSENHSKPQLWRGVLALPGEGKANGPAACCGDQEEQLERSDNIYPPGQVIF